MIARYHQLFRYDVWANREVLAALPDSPPLRSLKFLAHILGTEYCWHSRLTSEKACIAIWPDLTVADCQHHSSRLGEMWSAYLDLIGEPGLAKPITYQNTKGQTFTNSVEDILMHVIMHSAYHRGQIASDMRASGLTPAYTDFIHGVRQGCLE